MPRNDTARIDEALKAAKSASEDELQHQHDNIMASFRRSKEMRVPGMFSQTRITGIPLGLIV